jgi:hypothetical protein
LPLSKYQYIGERKNAKRGLFSVSVNLLYVLRLGKEGDIFQVVNTPEKSFLGKKYIVVKDKRTGKNIIKEYMGEGVNHSKGKRFTPRATAGLLHAEFEKVQNYKRISFAEAMKLLEEGKTVLIKDGEDYKYLSRFTRFSELKVGDVDDLTTLDYYTEI